MKPPIILRHLRPRGLEKDSTVEDRTDRKLENEQDKSEIREIIYRLARAIDRMDWDSIIALSDSDTFYDYGAYKGNAAGLVAWMVERHENVFRSTHHIGNILADFGNDAALVETYVNSIQTVPSPTDQTQLINVLACARYIDEFRHIGGEWRLKSRHVLIDNQVISPALASLPATLNEGRRDGEDMLWRERSRLGIPDAG